MADKSSHSPSPGVNGGIDEKTRLTEEEKKQNHIASGILLSAPVMWPARAMLTIVQSRSVAKPFEMALTSCVS